MQRLLMPRLYARLDRDDDADTPRRDDRLPDGLIVKGYIVDPADEAVLALLQRERAHGGGEPTAAAAPG